MNYQKDLAGKTLVSVHNLSTFMSTKDNETHLCGLDQDGNPIHLILNTIELLEYLDIQHMKDNSVEYINSLQKLQF